MWLGLEMRRIWDTGKEQKNTGRGSFGEGKDSLACPNWGGAEGEEEMGRS